MVQDTVSKPYELTHTYRVTMFELVIQGSVNELLADLSAHSHSTYTQSQNAQRVLVVVSQGTIAGWEENKSTHHKQDLVYSLAGFFAWSNGGVSDIAVLLMADGILNTMFS